MLTALASPKTKVDENLSRFKANVFDLLAVAGWDLCVRACWVKEKALHKTVKSAEKDSFGVEEMESTKSSACENSSLARLVPLPLAHL